MVTVKDWYMPRRVYGRVVGRNARYVFVQGSWGLGQFHPSAVREVRSNTAYSGLAGTQAKKRTGSKPANR